MFLLKHDPVIVSTSVPGGSSNGGSDGIRLSATGSPSVTFEQTDRPLCNAAVIIEPRVRRTLSTRRGAHRDQPIQHSLQLAIIELRHAIDVEFGPRLWTKEQ